jgi:hypothetical protein
VDEHARLKLSLSWSRAMKPELKCVVDNTVKTWRKNGLLHREDGPAVIKGSGENRIEEYWFEGCLVSAAMLELHMSLTPEIDEIIRNRKVVHLDSMRFK